MIPNDLGPREVQEALDQKWTDISSSSDVRVTDEFELTELADNGDPEVPSPGIDADQAETSGTGSKKAAAAGAAILGAGYLLTQ